MKWIKKGHQFDDLGNHFKNKSILIYGAGIAGKTFFENMKKMKLDKNIEAFVDKRAAEIKSYCGLPVYEIDKLFSGKDSKYIIIVAASHETKMILGDRLTRAGYIHDWEYFFDDEFSLYLNNIFLPVYALYVFEKVVLSSGCIIPSNVCNLNCRDCLNFTPYIKKFETRTLDTLKNDIDLFFNTVNFVAEYQISGGEPLLYPQIQELIEYIGENYREQIGRFETVLNGTIIPKDSICMAAKKYGLIMILDNYSASIPAVMNHRKEIIDQMEKYEVEWADNTVDEWFNLDIANTDNTKMTEEQLQEYFDICNNPWHCYENGKFYACNFAHFAEKAGINIEEDNSFFDISDFDKNKKSELMEFLLNYNQKGYVELCKRCSGWACCNPKKVPVAIQVQQEWCEK